MKNIIVKVPTLVFFLGLIAGPLISAYMKINNSIYYRWPNLLLLEIIQWGVIGIWMYSLVAYFSFESKSDKNTSIIYALISLMGITSIMEEFIWNSWVLYGLSLTSFVICMIFTVSKIKKVFYARSTWFIALELILIPVGFLTLTPEIKRWEKSDK